MPPKYYGVLVGEKPGVYRTWDDCKKQVHGFPGAQYKSFKTEQEVLDYLGLAKKKKSNTTKQNLDIYTDGSHQREIDYLGVGAWCEWDGVEYELSKHCSKEVLANFGIHDEVSNPTAEFVAVTLVLEHLTKIKSNVPITIHCDYLGPQNWISGAWQSKKDYIRKLKEICLQHIDKIPGKVSFKHVPAHTGVYGNECADKLAGHQGDVDTFADLIKKLNLYGVAPPQTTRVKKLAPYISKN